MARLRLRDPRRIRSEPVFKARWVTVNRNSYTFHGNLDEVEYLVIDTAEIAMAVPVTSRGRLVMVEQYKLPIEMRSLEFPAGAIGEGSALANAKRELLEETGYCAASWRKLGTLFSDTGRSRNCIHIFLGNNAERVRDQQLDAVETLCDLRVREVGRRELRKLAARGAVRSAGTLGAVALLATISKEFA
jgi:ADP-ribose diphosphatase